MTPRAYYNERDKYAAQWLRNLAEANVIMPGDVDERDIQDVRPDDLKGYTQHHFFAGIGVWSYALREAGWPDERPVWSGSCPCQPFSEAGKGAGFADERHLWPAWLHLARIYRPLTIFGEQVASPDGLAWLDLVSADLEGEGYTRGAVDTCAAGFGAPQGRQRLYFVADDGRGFRQRAEDGDLADADYAEWRSVSSRWDYFSRAASRWDQGYRDARTRRVYDRLACTDTSRFGISDVLTEERGDVPLPSWRSGIVGLADADSRRQEHELGGSGGRPGLRRAAAATRPSVEQPGADGAGVDSDPGDGAVNGFWAGASLVWCRDQGGIWRPTEPGTFPLAHESPARMGRLSAYGNAINAEQAIAFIAAYLDEEAEAVTSSRD